MGMNIRVCVIYKVEIVYEWRHFIMSTNDTIVNRTNKYTGLI